MVKHSTALNSSYHSQNFPSNVVWRDLQTQAHATDHSVKKRQNLHVNRLQVLLVVIKDYESAFDAVT